MVKENAKSQGNRLWWIFIVYSKSGDQEPRTKTGRNPKSQRVGIKKQQIMRNVNSIISDWSPYEPLNSKDKRIFNEALRGRSGVSYEPYSVSSRDSDGAETLHKYKCKARVSAPGTQPYEAIVQVRESRDGKSYFIDVTRVG